jgi:hypothetical protein
MVNCHSWHFQVSSQMPRALGLASVTCGSRHRRFAKGSVNFTIGKLIDELKAFERFVRLVGGRRNIYVWLLDVYDCDRGTNARSPADPSRF